MSVRGRALAQGCPRLPGAGLTVVVADHLHEGRVPAVGLAHAPGVRAVGPRVPEGARP